MERNKLKNHHHHDQKQQEICSKFDLTCETLKSIALCEYKSRTRGIAISALNCGIVNGYRELFGSENNIIENYENEIPKFLIYDDGCHLK
ncbi:hypothetical protein BpHYR1_038171 [Brachionus plicatilis]|uniref:Uncharacterized protein n=1 Tax=Brachionus plicatilis TaxID=10195 RepID=A0A3M7PYW9_BRAPC|nr:hypothetical protein BpHYR1_038171 [Brachionus plicatilis]